MLVDLRCDNNDLEELDLSYNTNLSILFCGNNDFTSIDLSNQNVLTLLDCKNNQISALDISNMLLLRELNCFNNQIDALDLAANPSLEVLKCANNPLTGLDVTGNPSLIDLRCNGTGIDSLDLGNNTQLSILFCDDNYITELDLSFNSQLTVVDCRNNHLESLDFRNGNNTAITSFNAINNPLLTCISVDDPSFNSGSPVWTSGIDSGVIFSTNCQDQDGDGYSVGDGDCDDFNPNINPGATEKCNGIDDNCDGVVDEDLGIWNGDYVVTSQADVDNWGNYSRITGELKIENTDVTDLTPFSCLVQVGKLFIQNNSSLVSLDGMENLQLVDDYLVINYNPMIDDATQFASLLDVGNFTQFVGNSSIERIKFPMLQSTGNNNTALHVHTNTSLVELSFPQLTDVDGLLTIRNNPLLLDLDFSSLLVAEDVDLNNLPLPDLSQFAHLNTVTGMFYVSNLDSVTTLNDLDQIDIQGGISVFFNDNLTSLGSLGTSTSFNEDVYIQYNSILPSLSGMEDITSISGLMRITNNPLLADCCAISDLLDSGGVTGEVTIEFNPQFCGSETEIINFCTDDDGDGFSIGDGDCDDTDPQVYPGATERCNGIDDDCDGTIDEDLGVWSGNFIVTSQADLDNWGSYSEVTGNLNILNTDVTDLSALSCLRKTKQLVIIGNPHLQSLHGLENLEIITGSLRIIDNDSLTQITEMVSLDTVGFNMGISDNDKVETISFPSLRWAGDFVFSLEVSAHPILHTISCPVLEKTTADLSFTTSPQLTNYHFPVLSEVASINFNQVGITNLNTFNGIQTITEDLIINTCPAVTDISGLDNTNFQGGVFLLGCTDLSSLGEMGANTAFSGGITLKFNPNLISLAGMDDITSIGGNLTIQNNTTLSDCCSIADLLDQGGVSGSITISNNPQFCGDEPEIISYCLDNDGDGYTVNEGDCDDNDASVNPGQPEICNGLDDDCNGLVDLDDPGLEDNDPPLFTGSLPLDITVSCDNVPNSGVVEFTDNCHAEMEFRQTSDWDGSCGNYLITRKWKVTDVGGSSIEHVQTITVEDNTPPSLVGSLPGDVTIPEGSVPGVPTITAVDDCYSGKHVFMEMDPIDPSNESLTLTGTLGDVGVTWVLEGVDVTQYKFRDVYTDNSLTTFSNGTYFTPSSTGLDGAGFNAISGMATLRITFDQPVDNPVLHINNIDISRWDFNPTTDHISMVSGNDQFEIVNGVVVDVDPTTSGGLNSGLGSVMIHGTFNEIVIDISLVDVTIDGIFLQLSRADDPQVIFTETSVPGVCPGDETITRTWTATDGCGLSTSHTQIITVEGIDPGPSIDQIDVPQDPIELGSSVSVVGYYSDICDIDDHQATWNWGDGNSSAGIVDQVNNWVDGVYTYDSSGVYQVTLIISDSDGNSDTLTAGTYVVIYNPEGGFVTGGGWIQSPPGAYVPDPSATGKANFGFVSKYQKGASVPTGNTQFKFNAAVFKFKSTSYDWLVISGSKAKYKGDGKVNNQGNYGFMLTGIDGDLNGSGGGVDKFRIKIWDKDQNDLVVYDNKMGSDDTGYDTQELGGGSITIHGTKGNGGGNNAQSYRIVSDIPKREPSEINVYPNPSQGKVNISLDNFWLNDPSSLTVHDINGKLISHLKNIRDINVVLDIENEGVYFITISNATQHITKKCFIIR